MTGAAVFLALPAVCQLMGESAEHATDRRSKASGLTVLYASQTGNAEWIAKNVNDEARERGFKSTCYVLDEHEKMEVETEPFQVLVFVVSTTGDGEPPENSLKFWEFLKEKAKRKESLSHVRYALLGMKWE